VERVHVKAKTNYLGKMHKVDPPDKVLSIGGDRVVVTLDEFLGYRGCFSCLFERKYLTKIHQEEKL